MISSKKAAIAALMLSAFAVSGAQQIQVQVDGTAVIFRNAQAQYINGRVLVPMRGVFEQLGAHVNWDRATRMVSATKGETEIRLQIGAHHASVNGTEVRLDVPPMVIEGATMVPIRFVSEALGAQVGWLEAQHLVTIDTGSTRTETVVVHEHHLRRAVLEANEVIPLKLDQTLSTSSNRRGDKFTATIETREMDTYADLPRGTKVEGHIAAIHPRSGNRPAILDITFDRLRFPDGKAVHIDGSLISLDGDHAAQEQNGQWKAHKHGQDQRMVYAGYGAGAGLLVGVASNRPLEGAVLGGALGYIVGQVQQDQHMTSNITLDQGTEMGVRINSAMTASW